MASDASGMGLTPDELVQAIDAARVDTDEARVTGLEMQVSDDYATASADLVRPQHALETLRQPDGVATYEYSGSRLVIATRRIVTRRGSYVMLVLADGSDDSLEVRAAYRLYADGDEARVVEDPSQAFAWLLIRYGVDFTNEGRRVRFLPAIVVDANPPRNMGEFEEVIATALPWILPGDEGELFASIRAMVRSTGQTVIAWPFAILIDRYKAEVRPRRR